MRKNISCPCILNEGDVSKVNLDVGRGVGELEFCNERQKREYVICFLIDFLSGQIPEAPCYASFCFISPD